MNSHMADSMLQNFENKIASGELQDDPGQRGVLRALIDLERRLSAAEVRRGLFGFRKSPVTVPGAYLWGGVGRGKSMLMDMFFADSAVEKKMRRHFLEFMQHVHVQMNRARKEGVDDAVLPVARGIAAEARLLCLDECQISDIADAMIVGRLFKLLIEQGAVVVTTSNRPPADLYKNGINRHLFLPFIELIHAGFEVHEIGTGPDHRRNRLSGETKYFVPADAEAANRIDEIWKRLTGGECHQRVLMVNGRPVTLDRYCNGAARAGFWDLCGQPNGPADFLAISKAVRVLIVENIPFLSRSNYNEAKRFVMLIDALYEARVRLVSSAEAEPEMLYVEGAGSFEFERTASRLREMQSGCWNE